jgi:acid phosphatase
MKTLRMIMPLALLLGCSAESQTNDPRRDLGLLWVKHSAEYQAISRQVYSSATNALPGFIEDKSWSAMPTQADAGELPPAIILDVDETVVSNVDFQLEYERPFANHKLDEWTRRVDATPIAGVADFVAAARAQGVTVFFITNRPCELIDGNDDPCPQKQSTIDDIKETGIEADAEHVLLSEEQGWNREKSGRRELIASTHRVIMLLGDDLNDFVACTRSSPRAPCTEAATSQSRQEAVVDYAAYWGHGWYILPNPMHGSWTTAQ